MHFVGLYFIIILQRTVQKTQNIDLMFIIYVSEHDSIDYTVITMTMMIIMINKVMIVSSAVITCH